MTGWQPIETAPKDGTPILGYPAWSVWSVYPNGSRISYVMAWCEKRGAWIEAAGEEYQSHTPTHWMPLPEPPQKEP